MTIRTFAVALEPGDSPETVEGIAIPAATREAAARAGGALVRTIYAADDGHGSVAALLGYHRPHTVQEKLTVPGGDRRLWPALVAFAEREAVRRHGSAVVKFEGIDGHAGIRACDLCHERHPAHYRQTTEFTCGPVALLDALHRRGLVPAPTRAAELALWREATMAVACDPYGLALAADRRGARVEVWVSARGPVLHPDSRLGILDARLARDTQEEFERLTHERGIPVRVGPFDAGEVGRLVDEGHLVALLIDELAMHGESCPHWITVTGRDPASDALLVDDPWTDSDFGESSVDAHQLAIRPADLDLMIHYDAPRSAQALLVL